jgi:hypothetical protein
MIRALSHRTASHPRSGLLAKLAIGVALALVFVAQPSAAAAAPISQPKTTYTTAGYFHQDHPEGGATWTDTMLRVDGQDGVATVCLQIATYSPAEPWLGTSEFGCATVPAGGFSMDTSRLSGASLSAITITVEQYSCTPLGECELISSRPVSVPTTTWTGVGTIDTFKFKSKSTFGGCSITGTGRGSNRQANVAPGGDIGYLGTSTSRMRVTCV